MSYYMDPKKMKQTPKQDEDQQQPSMIISQVNFLDFFLSKKNTLFESLVDYAVFYEVV